MKANRVILSAFVLLAAGTALLYWQRYQIGWNLLWVLKPSAPFSEIAPAPDYELAVNWAIRTTPDGATASVFYVHPTSFLSGDTWNQSLAASYQDNFLLENLMPDQVAPFGAYATFAPHYRQAIIYALQMKESGPQAIDLASDDVADAFEHFLKTAPTESIVLLGHSQGALLMSGLLASLRDRPEVLRRIVVAYLIGWALPTASLGDVVPLEACDNDFDTGCLISYNARDNGGYYIPPIIRRAINVTERGYRELRDEPIVCWSPIGATSTVTGACTSSGWLEISTPPKDKFDFLMSKGWYHTVEIPLFADELRTDATMRVQIHQMPAL